MKASPHRKTHILQHHLAIVSNLHIQTSQQVLNPLLVACTHKLHLMCVLLIITLLHPFTSPFPLRLQHSLVTSLHPTAMLVRSLMLEYQVHILTHFLLDVCSLRTGVHRCEAICLLSPSAVGTKPSACILLIRRRTGLR